ncbi:MAG: GHKL domain-containing protein [Firmicutes bacterium]|nr:GHKL domain-containing protein [Bacillota bacterium]
MPDVDNVDLTTIVGNIIDNAFDAVLMDKDILKKIVSLLIYEDYTEKNTMPKELPEVS